MPRYRMLTESGKDLGPLRVATPSWAAGDTIMRAPEDKLTVVRVVPAEDGDDVDGYLVVSDPA